MTEQRRTAGPGPVDSPARPTRRGVRTALVLAVTAALATAVPSAQAAPDTVPAAPSAAPAPAAAHGPAAKPFMGWSSWSMQTSSYPGLNPTGDYSYLTEANVLKQADAMADKLKPYGYEYVNIASGRPSSTGTDGSRPTPSASRAG